MTPRRSTSHQASPTLKDSPHLQRFQAHKIHPEIRFYISVTIGQGWAASFQRLFFEACSLVTSTDEGQQILALRFRCPVTQ